MAKAACCSLALLAATPASAFADAPPDCRYRASSWNELGKSRREELLVDPPFHAMSEHCLVEAVTRFIDQGEKSVTIGDSAAALVRRYALLHDSLSLESFLVLTRLFERYQLFSAAPSLAKTWERHNGSFRAALARYQASGRYASADTLYEALAGAHAIDVFDLSQWAQIKGVLEDYVGASEVFCRVSKRDERLVNMSLSQLERVLSDATPARQRLALKRFFECFVQSPLADTAALVDWLSSVYSRFGLYEEEIALLTGVSGDLPPKGRLLLASARRRFSGKLFQEAVSAALPAYRMLSTQEYKQQAAVVLYHAYAQLGKADSALAWFRTASVNDPASIGQASGLYQEAGMLDKADSLIETLPASIIKDSLAIRQLLYAGRSDSAYELAVTLAQKEFWRDFRDEAVVWQVRSAIFAGKPSRATAHLDTAHIPPHSPFAQEVYEYRLMLMKLKADPAAMRMWGKMQYAGFVNDTAMLPDSAELDNVSAGVRQLLIADLADLLIKWRQFEQARRALSRIPDTEKATPHSSYLLGQAKLREGALDEARSIFEALILEHPDDVFAGRARIYLMKIDQNRAM
jgi:tetratricopeptide (TPR) repeat protein